MFGVLLCLGEKYTLSVVSKLHTKNKEQKTIFFYMSKLFFFIGLKFENGKKLETLKSAAFERYLFQKKLHTQKM